MFNVSLFRFIKIIHLRIFEYVDSSILKVNIGEQHSLTVSISFLLSNLKIIRF